MGRTSHCAEEQLRSRVEASRGVWLDLDAVMGEGELPRHDLD